MEKTFKRIIIACVALIAIAGIAVALVVSGGLQTKESDPLADVKNATMNAALDASGVKARIEDELYDHASEIAEKVGVSPTVVNNAIKTLDVQDWTVTSLPESASENGSFNFETDDISASITTYDDPSIATVQAYGQTMTLKVPESAQPYMTLLGLIS